MSITEIKVRDGEARKVCLKVERHKGSNPSGPLQYVDRVVGSALVFPRPAEDLLSVSLRVGPRAVPFELVYEALDPKRNLRECTCYVDADTITLVPLPPFPEALIRLETRDGG